MKNYKEGMEQFLEMAKNDFGVRFLSVWAKSKLTDVWAEKWNEGGNLTPETALKIAKEKYEFEVYGDVLGAKDTPEIQDTIRNTIIGDAISVSNHPVMFK